VIGVEFASVRRPPGAEVTIAEMLPQLPLEDEVCAAPSATTPTAGSLASCATPNATPGPRPAPVQLSHPDLADWIGTCRETVDRALHRWRDRERWC
jgi:hypothetical protein